MKKQQRMGKNNKAQVLRTASELFSVYGYHGTCMRDLARAAGLSPSSIYTHIRSKHELLQEVVYMAAAMFLHQAMTVPDGAPIEHRFVLLARGHMEVLMREWSYAMVLFHEARFLDLPSLMQAQKTYDLYESHFYGAIEAGTTQGIFHVSRVDLAARFVLSALNWTYLWPKPREPYNQRTADQYVQLILHALQAGQLPPPFL